MAKVKAHTPAWLSRPSAGFQAFQRTVKTNAPSTLNGGYGKKIEHTGPLRILAHRETEIFYVVDNEVRWSDLVLLKDAGETNDFVNSLNAGKDVDRKPSLSGSLSQESDVPSRVLKTSVAGQIRQLVISPLGDFMAIVTSHTVHVAVLPRKFDTATTEPLRPKVFQLGPTIHVLEQAPIASVIWHPLGALGTCLVTVAADACVRLWELDTHSRQSFTEPALALDLKKLANAASYDEDMRASRCGTSKGFSPDQVEMEVAAACFGGIGAPDELGWAAMTLWVAMAEGDVYALCPLLPSKWQPSTSTVPSLSTSVVSKASILEQDSEASDTERRQATQQKKWLQDIDSQEPMFEVLPGGMENVEIYQRPTHPPAIPKLQGPFRLSPEPEYAEISDIIAIAPRLDEDSLADEDEDEYDVPPKTGISIGVICLLTRAATVYICLDVNGVEAMWLPARRMHWEAPTLSDSDASLLIVESIELGTADTDEWPAFTPGIMERYAAAHPLQNQQSSGSYTFYVTQSTGTHMCDLSTWIANMEDELSGPNDTGSSFRVGLMYESDKSQVEQLISISSASTTTTAAISVIDSDLGHFIMTVSANQPYSAALDLPVALNMLDSYAPEVTPLAIDAGPEELREPYRPAKEFYIPSTLSSLIDSTIRSGTTRLTRNDLKSQVRLSPATLQLLTESHRVLSAETNALGLAAADLFRRCTRMQAELAEQIRRVREVRQQADAAIDAGDDKPVRAKVADRVKGVQDRDARLQERLMAVRRKLAGAAGAMALSKKEEAWGVEAKEVDSGLEGLGERVATVNGLKADLLARVKDVEGAETGKKDDALSGVTADLRRKGLEQIMVMLERESALVDAVSERLGRLSVIDSL